MFPPSSAGPHGCASEVLSARAPLAAAEILVAKAAAALERSCTGEDAAGEGVLGLAQGVASLAWSAQPHAPGHRGDLVPDQG